MIKKGTSANTWKLYWVESDSIEDCFVVAKNSRSACRIERDMNGFDPEDIRAIKITSIPSSIEKSYKKNKKHTWPWYVYGKTFFESLGADFRTVENKEEMLLKEVAYSVSEYIPCGITRKRSIGVKALHEIQEAFKDVEHHDEDVWHSSQEPLITMVGICIVRCQQIEHYVAHSFILSALFENQRKNSLTINDVVKGWKKKTFGSMLHCIEEAYEIEPTLKEGLKLFLEMRNKLVHGITVSDEYNIDTQWGRDELVAFLALFDVISRVVKMAFRSSFYASIEYASLYMSKDMKLPKNLLNKKQREEAGMFGHFFKVKP